MLSIMVSQTSEAVATQSDSQSQQAAAASDTLVSGYFWFWVRTLKKGQLDVLPNLPTLGLPNKHLLWGVVILRL